MPHTAPKPMTFAHRYLATLAATCWLASCASMSGTSNPASTKPGSEPAGVVVGTATTGAARSTIASAAVGGAVGALVAKQMDQQAKELAQSMPDARIERVSEGIVITLSTGQLFEFDSDRVLGESARNLRAVARSLDKFQGTSLLIVGHTDALGTSAYNHDLSLRRARSTAAYLTSQGTLLERMKSDGRGEDEPIATGNTEAGQARNRRVEIAIFASEAMRAKLAAAASGIKKL